jgi:Zn finger protein HypA/HybF involved in hydrogenase expression
MTTTALQQLLAELDAAPAGCLDDVRRWVRTLAMEMMQMQAPTLLHRTMRAECEAQDDEEDCDCWECPNERHLDPDGHLPMCPQSMAHAFDVERQQLIVMEHIRDEVVAKLETRDADASVGHALARRTLRQTLAKVQRERDLARAEVERLTRERDRAQDGLLAVSQERNRIERETVTAIAAYLRRRAGTIASSSLSRDRLMQAAAAIDNDEWRTK